MTPKKKRVTKASKLIYFYMYIKFGVLTGESGMIRSNLLYSWFLQCCSGSLVQLTSRLSYVLPPITLSSITPWRWLRVEPLEDVMWQSVASHFPVTWCLIGGDGTMIIIFIFGLRTAKSPPIWTPSNPSSVWRCMMTLELSTLLCLFILLCPGKWPHGGNGR